MNVENYKICYTNNKREKKVNNYNHHLFQVLNKPCENLVNDKKNNWIMNH